MVKDSRFDVGRATNDSAQATSGDHANDAGTATHQDPINLPSSTSVTPISITVTRINLA